ncbi:hypothetical protein HGRIS_003134 [Hohenbuehelia grisea]
MLEEALRQGSVNGRDVGWQRRSTRENELAASGHRPHSVDYPASTREEIETPPLPSSATIVPTPASPVPQDKSFFKFRFSSSSSNGGSKSASVSRPDTPSGSTLAAPPQHGLSNLASPSLPSIPDHVKEVEDLTAELERERKAHQKAQADRAALEEELESLSQALFEEANKMVASERRKRADMAEELQEAILEKEALRSALRLIEGQSMEFHSSASSSRESVEASPILPASISHVSAKSAPTSRSRSSSQVGVKSRPGSPDAATTPLPRQQTLPTASASRPVSPASIHLPDSPPLDAMPSPATQESDSPQLPQTLSSTVESSGTGTAGTVSYHDPTTESAESAWADVSSASPALGAQPTPKARLLPEPSEGTYATAALYSLR